MNIVLGGGIAGLVVAYHRKGYDLITDKVGGQMKSTFPLGPRMLHATKEMSDFLVNDLSMITNKKLAVIGYSDGLRFASKASDEFREKYFEKSRHESSENMTSGVMSNAKNVFEYYDVGLNTVISRLTREIAEDERIIEDTVQRIDVENKIVYTRNDEYVYENLVSTLPLPVFNKLAGLNLEYDFSALDKTFVLVRNCFLYDNTKSYIYFINQPFTRITQYENGQHIVEFTGLREEEALQHCVDRDMFVMFSQQLPRSQIKKSIDVLPEIDGVEFVGRYSRWNHSIRTEDIVKHERQM